MPRPKKFDRSVTVVDRISRVGTTEGSPISSNAEAGSSIMETNLTKVSYSLSERKSAQI